MATTLDAVSVVLDVLLSWTATKNTDAGTVKDRASLSLSPTITFSTGAGACDLVWSDIRLLAASANEILDLAGVLTDAFGDTVTAAKVKAIVIKNVSDETNPGETTHVATDASITFGTDATAGFVGPWTADTDRTVLKDKEIFLITDLNDGWAVGAGASDELYVENLDGADEAAYAIALLLEAT